MEEIKLGNKHKCPMCKGTGKTEQIFIRGNENKTEIISNIILEIIKYKGDE